MDKQNQKQIEEMAKVIEEAMQKARRTLGVYNNIATFYAEILFNAGYRKIPENAVVLTKGTYFSREEVDEISETAIKNSREETAEKFAERLKERYMPPLDEWDEISIGSLFYEIDEICKKIVEEHASNTKDLTDAVKTR